MCPLLRTWSAILLLTTALPLTAQLNGIYTIGTAGNYTSFTAAVAALTTNGVSGPVIFNVFSGTYAEQISIGTVAGASSVNTITFQSQALDSTAVVITHPSQPTNASDWVVRLGGVDYITFRKMTFQRTGTNSYGRCFHVAAGSTDFNLLNCRFLPSNSAASHEAVYIYNSTIGTCMIDRCAVVDGIGANLQYISSGSLAFTNNTLSNVRIGVTTFTISVPLIIAGNRIQTANLGVTRGLVLQTVSGGLQVRGNTITGDGGTFAGMLMSSVNGTVLLPARIENNIIIGTASVLDGMFTTGGTTNYLDIVHNSISMLNGGLSARALALNVGSGTGCRLFNNIFLSSGPAVKITPASRVSASDNNIFHSTDGYGVHWGSTYYYDIPALFAGTTRNGNSFMADPSVVDPLADLHLRAGSVGNGRAQAWAGITDDIDGQSRPLPVASQPDIGADETTYDCTPLSGTYTVGTSLAAHFTQVGGAAAKLSACGISGPVLILIESGTYNERVVMNGIPGTSATNTVTFRSQANDSAAVVITRPSATNSIVDHTLVMSGADRVTWDRVTFQRTGSSSFAQVVSFVSTAGTAGSQFTRFTHCRLQGVTSNVPLGALVGAIFNGDEDSVRFDHTRFVDGTYGVQWSCTNDHDLLLLEDNVFDGQSISGVSLAVRDRHFTVRGNRFQSTVAAAVGMSIGNSTAGFEISGNQVQMISNAMLLSGSIQATTGEPRIYNNMLQSTNAAGLVLMPSSASGLRIDNNSIWASTYGLHLGSGTVTVASLRNNILASATNYAFYRQLATHSITLASHNVLYRGNAGPFAFWTAYQTTMAGLQAASGQFANSAIADPLFYDAPSNDLHAYAMELDAAGTPITHVNTDFDGVARHISTPDIGADEFTPALWVAPMNTCGMCDPIICNGSGTDRWIYKDRRVVARINDNGQNLGTVTMSVYVHSGAVRQSDLGQYYMDRNWNIDTQNSFVSPISVRVFCTSAEFATYAAADPLVTTAPTAGLVHYNGVLENCLETDNPSGQQWTPLVTTNGNEPRIQIPGVPGWFSGSIAADGELYLTAAGQVLPVELIAFTGARVDDREVRLDWTTASEHGNAGFEVWRMIEGETEFKEVGWVEGAGNSQQTIAYTHLDDNAANGISYYKLKQVDMDGQSAWSPVVAVEGAIWGDVLSVFPNPAADRATLTGLDPEGSVISLHDASGREVGRWYDTNTIDGMGELERGAYLLRATDGAGSSRSIRLVLQ